MRENSKDDLQNFKLLEGIRDRMLHARLVDAESHADELFYRSYSIYRRKRKKKALIMAMAASAAAVIIMIAIQKSAENYQIEKEYFRKQSEWIAISDEAILTSEYLKMYNTHEESNENDWIWPTLD